jgi:hypothetical protein
MKSDEEDVIAVSGGNVSEIESAAYVKTFSWCLSCHEPTQTVLREEMLDSLAFLLGDSKGIAVKPWCLACKVTASIPATAKNLPSNRDRQPFPSLPPWSASHTKATGTYPQATSSSHLMLPSINLKSISFPECIS